MLVLVLLQPESQCNDFKLNAFGFDVMLKYSLALWSKGHLWELQWRKTHFCNGSGIYLIDVCVEVA